MATVWASCAGCGNTIKAHFQYCPVCKTNKPFRCGKCSRRFGGPLRNGVNIVNNQVRCSGCNQVRTTTVIRTGTTVPKKQKKAYDRYFNSTGTAYPDWYAYGYERGYKDGESRLSCSPSRHATYYPDSPHRSNKDYVKGYSDGYRAGRN
jgi:hypothetical protein